MPKSHLTDITIKNLKAPISGQTTYWDAGLTGFGVRVSPGGSKTFTVIYGVERRRVTIGRYPILSLLEARTAAKRLLAEATLDKSGGKAPSQTFAEGVELYLATHCAQNNREKTRYETARLLRKHFVAKFKERPLESISSHDISTVVDALLVSPSVANHAFTAIRSFFRWTTRRRYIGHSPCEGLQLPSRIASRDRVLNDGELGAICRAARTMPYPFGPIVLLLLLTGQRRGEISAVRWDYIDEQEHAITLPASLTKNKRQHRFPYGHMCAEVLSRIPKVDDVYLFPARGNPERSYSGWSKGKAALDQASGTDGWTLHDLRRTVATNLAALKVPPHVTERLLNHVSGTVSGVAAIYNRHAYMGEMREALDAWECKVRSLIAS